MRLHNKFPVKAKYFRTLKYRKLQRTFMRLYSEAAWPVKNDLTMWREHLKNGKDGLDDSFVPMTAPDVSALPPAKMWLTGADYAEAVRKRPEQLPGQCH